MNNENKPIDSPFFSDFPNPADRERVMLHGREWYNFFRAQQTLARSGHMDYGKWLIASLLAVHGASLYSISGLRTAVDTSRAHVLVDAASLSLCGVGFTLLTGFFAWLNLQMAEIAYHRFAKPEMLYRNDFWPKNDSKFDPVWATLLLCAGSGLISGFMFIGSAVNVIQALR